MNELLDTSQELRIIRHLNGIQLIHPHPHSNPVIVNPHDTGHTISSIFKLPLSIYLLNTQSQLQNCNEVNIEFSGVDSIKQCLKKTIFDMIDAKKAKKIITHDEEVLKSHRLKILEEEGSLNGMPIHALSFKMPWYNSENKIVGLFGLSLFLGINSLSEALTHLSQTGLMSTKEETSKIFIPGTKINNIYLSKRESIILQYAIRGYSATSTGKLLNISSRTVEYHIENLKFKLEVRSKSELIDKAIDLFLKI